jgi:hypothetical protein
MEPLLAGDPTHVGEYQIRGRIWVSGALTVYMAEHGSTSALLFVTKNGPQVEDVHAHSWQLKTAMDSIQGDSEALGGRIVGAGATQEFSYIAYQIPPGTSLRERIYKARRIDAATATEMQRAAVKRLEGYSGVSRLLITPDTIFWDGSQVAFLGLGTFQMLEMSAPPGSSLGVNSVEWFAPETLELGSWTPLSARYSFAASLLAAAAGNPWAQPIQSMADLFGRQLNISLMQQNAELSELIPWLNAVPELRDQIPRNDTSEPVSVMSESDVKSPRDQGVELAPQEPDTFSTFTSLAPVTNKKNKQQVVLISVVATVLIAAVVAIGLSALGGSNSETTASETQSSDSSDPAVEVSASEVAVDPDPAYEIRLDYSSDAIPNQVPTGGLAFTFDVCSGDPDWLKKNFQEGVQLQLKRGASWVDVASRPSVIKGGRCDADQYNLTFTRLIEPPNFLSEGGTWSTCLSYRVNLPETTEFKKFSVPFCAFVRQTA